jgi:imidazolonepropionase-like amidohydrolase
MSGAVLTDKGGILGAPRLLNEAGVKFALSQGTAELGSTLLDYAQAAVRGGLKPGDAIAAISGWPASIVGVGKNVGTIAWEGRRRTYSGPLARRRLLAVIIDGRFSTAPKTP